jgi:hypothetical protein
VEAVLALSAPGGLCPAADLDLDYTLDHIPCHVYAGFQQHLPGSLFVCCAVKLGLALSSSYIASSIACGKVKLRTRFAIADQDLIALAEAAGDFGIVPYFSYPLK